MKKMLKPQKIIIDALKENSLTPLELQLLTGYVYNGVTSRISELRKLGYDIQLQKVATSKYVLVKTSPKEIVDKVLTWVEKHNRYGVALEYDMLAKELDMRVDQVVDGMVELYKMKRLVQISSTKSKVMM